MPSRRSLGPLELVLATALLLLPGLTVAAGTVGFLPFLSLPALFILPALLLSDGEGPSEGNDDDGGGGGGQPPRPRPPKSPWGGVPLPDADPARVRRRDHSDRGSLRRHAPPVHPGRERIPSHHP